MWKITLKNLAANKARLGLTGLAIVLGVGFVVASFITSDGLRDAFGTLSKDISSGPELVVREGAEFGVNPVIDESTLATVSATDGVAVAAGTISGRVQPITGDGTPVETAGPPLIGFSWSDAINDGRSTIVEGAPPGPGQFVMDLGSAEANGFELGGTYSLVTTEGRFDDFTLSGTFRFGENNDTLGAVLTGYSIDDTRTLLGVPDGQFEEIEIVTADGWNATDVQAALADQMTAGIDVVNQQTVEDETAADFNEAIGIIENVFLGFAGVSLFVSIFIIYNTFGVVLAQRVREIGMLRAVGAEAKQIRRGIIGESLAIGIIASAIGIAAGIGLHMGLLALFDLIGVGLPDTSLIIAPRTIIIGMAVGVIATIVSAIAPAIRASRVTPIAALNGQIGSGRRAGSKRIVTGIVMLVAGVVLGALGFGGLGTTAATVAALAGGAVLVFLAVTLLSPLAARPVIGTLAIPMSAAAGTKGALAGKNAVRNPRRTATTAGALMIGLSLITAALVVGDSLKAQIGQTISDSISADYLISDPNFFEVPVEVADEVAAMPEIGNVMTVSDTFVRINPPLDSSDPEAERPLVEELWYNVSDLDSVAGLMDLGIDRGSLENVSNPNALVLPSDEADEYGMEIGDTMLVEFSEGGSAEFELVATSTDETIVNGGWLNQAGVDEYVEATGVTWIAAQVADGFTAAEAETAMAAVTVDFPQVEVQSSAQYQESIEAEVDLLLNTISAMLALAIVIALLGIGLTLALSIVERTREIGLLRAVGMTRGQTRGMIRWEAAAIAMFGAVLGVATGLLFGWGAVQALPDTFITVVSVPVTRLVLMVAAAGIAGLIAALLPARRAGRLNVLDAIAIGG